MNFIKYFKKYVGKHIKHPEYDYNTYMTDIDTHSDLINLYAGVKIYEMSYWDGKSSFTPFLEELSNYRDLGKKHNISLNEILEGLFPISRLETVCPKDNIVLSAKSYKFELAETIYNELDEMIDACIDCWYQSASFQFFLLSSKV